MAVARRLTRPTLANTAGASDPRIRSTRRWPQKARARSESPTPPDSAEFARRCRHVRGVLEHAGVHANSPERWVEAFIDDADPTFPVRDWVWSGWSDPNLVDLFVRHGLSRVEAEALMSRLQIPLGSAFSSEVVARIESTFRDPDS